jgi:hypothetical protein
MEMGAIGNLEACGQRDPGLDPRCTDLKQLDPMDNPRL